jgi:peroxiredoxin
MNSRWIGIAFAIVLGLVAALWLPLNRGAREAQDRPAGSSGATAGAGAACPANAPAANLDVTLKDMHGRDVKLADYRGKVILLNFWATWCGPCRLEIPAFVEMQDRFRKDGLVVLGLSVDDPPEKLPPFAEEFKMNYPVLVGLDREDVLEKPPYGPLVGVPVSFLIGRNGKICSKHIGMASKAEFEKEIRGLL